MVTLKSFDNYISANILCSRLQAEGITAVLTNEHTNTIFPVLGNAIGGIKLDVPLADAEKASSLLKTFEEAYARTLICPKCQAQQFLRVPRKEAGNMITAVLTWAFSNYAMAPDYVYQCQQCGYESIEPPENSSSENENTPS